MKKILTILFSGICGIALGALTIVNLPTTNITTTSAWFNASITATNGTGTNPTCAVFYGTIDYTTNANSWGYSNIYGQSGVANISTNLTGLSALHRYYYRWRAIEGTSTAWSASTSNFWTKPIAPTSTPAVITISLQTDTNGLLKAPTNFFGVNSNLLIAAIGADTDTNAVWGNISGTLANQLDLTSTVAKAASAVQTETDSIATNLIQITSNAYVAADTVLRSELTNTITVASNHFESVKLNTNDANYQNLLTNTATKAQGALADTALQSETDTNALAQLVIETTARTNSEYLQGLTNADFESRKVSTNDASYLSILMSMTNFVPVESSSNYLSYDTATRLLNGCVTNTGGGGSSGFPLTENGDLAGYSLTNGSFIGNTAYFTNNLSVGEQPVAPTGIGAANFGIKSSGDMLATGVGAANFGQMAVNSVMTAAGVGSVNRGQISNGRMNANGIGAGNYGFLSSANWSTNDGSGSIALLDNSGDVLITNNASIVLGNGISLEDRSVLADVVRARVNFIGNGVGLTNLTYVLPWTNDVNAATGALNTAVGNLSTATNALNTRAGNLESATNALQVQVAALQGATGALHTSVGNLQISTNDIITKYQAADAGISNAYKILEGSANVHVTLTGTGQVLSVDAGAVDYGITDITAYRGDWGVAVSNIAVAATNDIVGLKEATNALNIVANAALPASFTNTGILTAVQITGGSPTNGAVLSSTNATGQGIWTMYPKISVGKTVAQVFTDSGDFVIPFDTVIQQTGGVWDGTNWTPGVIGYLNIQSSIQINKASATGFGYLYLNKNNDTVQYSERVYVSAVGYPTPIGSFLYYNSNATNKYSIWFSPHYGVTVTNYPGVVYNWMSGVVLP